MVAAVLLAAGSGSRFDGDTPKLLAELRGRPVLSHSLDSCVESGLDVIVVTGAVDVATVLDEPGWSSRISVVHNPSWAQGQAVSVRAGIVLADAEGHDAVVVGLGDQPFVPAEAWRTVAESDAPIAVATYDGDRGNPVRLSSSIWDLLPMSGDEVGRALMRDRPELVREIPCAGSASDIDTLEDLKRWI